MPVTLNDLDRLDVLINDAGQIPTLIDGSLGEATRLQVLKQYDDAQRQISNGHMATGAIGAKLEAIQQWSTAQRKKVAPTSGAPNNSATPYGVDNYGRAFKSQAEADDYAAALARWEVNTGGNLDAQQQAALFPGARDMRTMTADEIAAAVTEFGINTIVRDHSRWGPLAPCKHDLSSLLAGAGNIRDAGDGKIVPPSSLPQLAAWTVDQTKKLAGVG